MMNSQEDIKLYIDDKYKKFMEGLTKEIILQEALYIAKKKCFCSIRKKHKIAAFHKLMKDFILKLHNKILTKSPLPVAEAAHPPLTNIAI